MLFTKTIDSNRDFLYLYKRGKSIVTKAVVVYYRKNNTPFNRIGITSAKKIGNAVERNRARRIIRAAYREIEDRFPIGYDMIIVARRAAVEMKSYNVKKIFKEKVIPELCGENK